jgi:Fic family protein
MTEQGKRVDFIEGSGWFKVVLHLEPMGTEATGPREPEQTVLQLFEERVEISSADVCKALSVSKATAVGVLDRLLHSGRIRRIGKGPKTRYRIRGH